MFIGLLFAIGACFVWGLIFVIPQYLSDFSAVEVVLGRYLSYGILSAFLFFRTGLSRIRKYTIKAWVIAFLFALFSNLIYYLGLVAGLRFASPTLTVLVVGLAPITIALYGNWQAKEIAFRDLVIPCLWIIFGLVLVNVTEVDWSFKGNSSLPLYFMGLTGIFTALAAWTWFAVQNARFLKRHTHIPASEWSTVIGVGTLFWALLIGTIFALTGKEVEVSKFLTFSPAIGRYLIGSALLGVLCSWLGCFLWSRASVYLPISLMGPLLIFEMLFGLFFVFIFEKQLPSWIELFGVSSMIGGIFMSIYSFRKKHMNGSPGGV